MTVPAGLYLHIPFCLKKCAYCDFYSTAALDLKPSFVAALLEEIQLRSQPELPCDSIYLGGGTPSLLSIDAISEILQRLQCHFALIDPLEITIEANPATLTGDSLAGLRALGVNRINMGVQSFRENHLRFLGRCHSAAEAHGSIAAARSAGFDNLGLDLIYGLPDQTKTQWREDLTTALTYLPEHVACYLLSYEPKTPLDQRRHQGQFTPLSDARMAQLFEFTGRFLRSRGYEHYEISNFARRDSRCDLRSRHNRKYWNYAPYLGFGPGAHSYDGLNRRWNHPDLGAYITALSQQRLPSRSSETLTRSQQRLEALYLGLRQSAGIDLARFRQAFGADALCIDPKLLQRLEQEQMVHCDGTTLALTLKGMRYMDSIVPLLE